MTDRKNHLLPKWQLRFQIERLIRETLWSWNFMEARTPLLVKSPGMEPHICPIEVKRRNEKQDSPVFLPTSPEFALKKLLARGMTHLFQICSSFRDEPESPEHHPEFTMLEIYEAHTSLGQFETRIEKLFQEISQKFNGTLKIPFRGEIIDLEGSWPRFRIVDLFQAHLGIDLRQNQTSAQLHEVCVAHKIHATSG
jgi:lysyl-tRNA synthetase class II